MPGGPFFNCYPGPFSNVRCRYEKVNALGNSNFRSVIKTFKNHAPTIINYFRRRATNASAEAFNSKVKIFRSQMRGVRDRDFFIFRLVKLYA